jgi:hypothetical protein
MLAGTGVHPVMFRDGWSSVIESPHEPGSGAPPAGTVRCERGARRKGGAIPRICRAVSPGSTRGGPFRRPLGSRDQVRWLPHAGARAKRTTCHLHSCGLGLDTALSADRRCASGPAGERLDPGWRSRRRRFARHPRFWAASRRSGCGPQGSAALLRVRPALCRRARSAGGPTCRPQTPALGAPGRLIRTHPLCRAPGGKRPGDLQARLRHEP